MMPGMAKMAKQAEAAGMDDKAITRQIALINSMTKKERANPDMLQASRKKRIAAGAGMEVSELNKLLKMQKQMADTMKKLGKMGKGGMLKQAMRAMTGKGGGLPDLENFDPAKMAEAQKMLQDPRGLGGQLGKAGLPGGLSGMFGKK
jgi:signal recognition particle subunit SRP54